MDFLTGLLGGLDGLKNAYDAYSQSPSDGWLKKFFSSSSGSGQTLDGENALRSYFGYAPTSTEASSTSPGGSRSSDDNLLRSYFGYGPGRQGNGYRFGDAAGGSQKTSGNTSQNDATSGLATGTSGGGMNGSKRDFSGLLAGLWRQPMTPSEITGAIGMNANTGMYPMNYKGM